MSETDTIRFEAIARAGKGKIEAVSLIDSKDKPEDLVCPKSPDKKHHYEVSPMQSLVYIEHGSHTCYNCHYCGKQKCKTTYFPPPKPLDLPTDEDLDDKSN